MNKSHHDTEETDTRDIVDMLYSFINVNKHEFPLTPS